MAFLFSDFINSVIIFKIHFSQVGSAFISDAETNLS